MSKSKTGANKKECASIIVEDAGEHGLSVDGWGVPFRNRTVSLQPMRDLILGSSTNLIKPRRPQSRSVMDLQCQVLHFSSPAISRYHANFSFDCKLQKFYLEDNHSTNGTFIYNLVNKKEDKDTWINKLRYFRRGNCKLTPYELYPIYTGDEIWFGALAPTHCIICTVKGRVHYFQLLTNCGA